MLVFDIDDELLFVWISVFLLGVFIVIFVELILGIVFWLMNLFFRIELFILLKVLFWVMDLEVGERDLFFMLGY